MDKIIDTHKGNWEDNKDFWFHIFKYYYGGGSGVNPSIDGWIVNFFPYIDDKVSDFAKRAQEKVEEECKAGDKDDDKSNSGDEDDDDWFLEVDLTQPGLDIEKFKKAASGISSTPFIWSCSGQEHKMRFISGFAGAKMVEHEGDNFIKAQMGWAVAEDKPPKEEEKKPKKVRKPKVAKKEEDDAKE